MKPENKTFKDELIRQEIKMKDEDGYVDDWQIRTYSDCHPSSAVRVFTREEIEKVIDEVINKNKHSKHHHCLLEEVKQKLGEK